MTSIRLKALQRQVQRLDRCLEGLEQRNQRFSTARLFSALLMLTAGILALTLPQSTPYWMVTFAAALVFGTLVILHNRLQFRIERLKKWRHIKQLHIARLTLNWAALPQALDIDPQPEHPFEIDLDVTGEISLHRLLDTATTREGSERLRTWLFATAPNPTVIQHRQTLVKSLRSQPVFRDKLALHGGAQQKRRVSDRLTWLQGTSRVDPRIVLAFLAFAVLNAVLLVGNVLGVLPPVWRLTVPAFFAAFLLIVRSLGDIFEASLAARDMIETLHAVFQFLETDRFGAHAELRTLCAPFLDANQRPTQQLKRVRRVLFTAALRSNMILWLPLNLLLPWDMLVAWELDRVRKRLSHLVPQWLDVWFELEALCALATYADQHADAVFPVIGSDAHFEGQKLGHPLIPEAEKVRNDFTLTGNGRLVIITGSNMAGKSSFLRTLGLALCMAYAGGVVDAAALNVSAFRLFTCIRVSDSVTEGVSYFYAEVKRLKALLNALEETSPYPLFFLIDEIFKGTNNRERLIGSRSYIYALMDKPGMGLISTHDLELAQLAHELPGVSNAHFRENIIDGSMVFDYKLREGPSPTTNALKIMELAGLPIIRDVESGSTTAGRDARPSSGGDPE